MVLRFSLIFCLLDGADAIDVPHVDAALELWLHCRSSARWVVGDGTGNPTADRIESLLGSQQEGLSRTAISRRLSGHASKAELDEAIELLLKGGRATERRVQTSGRTMTIYLLGTEQRTADQDASSPEAS